MRCLKIAGAQRKWKNPNCPAKSGDNAKIFASHLQNYRFPKMELPILTILLPQSMATA